MLSTKNVENYYEITSLVTTINTINSFLRVNLHVKDRFSKVTSANVILIYMNIIIRGMQSLVARMRKLVGEHDFAMFQLASSFVVLLCCGWLFGVHSQYRMNMDTDTV